MNSRPSEPLVQLTIADLNGVVRCKYCGNWYCLERTGWKSQYLCKCGRMSYVKRYHEAEARLKKGGDPSLPGLSPVVQSVHEQTR